MGVVVREFEVSAEASESQRDHSVMETQASSRLGAQDLSSLVRREQKRLERVWAH